MASDRQNDNLKREVTEHLDAWVTNLISLEKNYFKNRMEISNKDVTFLKILGQSLYHFNTFSSLIIAKLNSNITNDKVRSELKSISRYIRFFNNLIASKMKYFFFREVPVINTNSPFFRVDVDIYQCAKEVYIETFSKEPKLKDLKANVAKLYFFSGLLYSFVYDSDTDKGVFLNYQYNVDKFISIKSDVLAEINSLETESDLRVFCTQFFVNYALSHVKYYDGHVNECKYKSHVYKLLCKVLSENKDATAEPLMSLLADIIWKFDGMLHDDDEFINKQAKVNQDRNIVKLLTSFVASYISTCDDFYRTNMVNYNVMFNTVDELIGNLFELILLDKSIYDISNAFTAINKITKSCDVVDILTIDTNHYIDNDIGKTLGRIRSRDESNFKLENLLNELSIPEFLSLLSLVFKSYHKDVLSDPETDFVGYYKSGIFIAHFINIVLGTNKPIWLFKTKPYVAIHPIHGDHGSNIRSILAFDESYKTGFTHSLYESYITRNLPLVKVNTTLCTLFRFSSYASMAAGNNTRVSFAIDLNEKLIPIEMDEIRFLSQLEFPVSKYSIHDFDANAIIDAILRSVSHTDRLDLTLILSNTHALLSVCCRFAHRIKAYLDKSKPIYLFSPSSSGQLLCLFTQLILKMNDFSVYCLSEMILSGIHQKVAIDLSVDTGFSLNYRWWASQKDILLFDPKYSAIDEFDLILTIAGRRNSYKNFHYLYEME